MRHAPTGQPPRVVVLRQRKDPVLEWDEYTGHIDRELIRLGTDENMLRIGDALAEEVKRLRLNLSDLDGAVEAVQRAHQKTWDELAETTAELETLKRKSP